MTPMSRLVGRILGPVCLAVFLGALLEPMTAQRSVRIDAAPFQLVDERIGLTLALILPAILAATVLWLPGAFLVAFRRGPAGLVTAFGTILAQALAPFVTGIVLLLWLGVREGLFPMLGAGTRAHLVLPSLTLGIALLGMLSHTTYLRAARRQSAEAHPADTMPGGTSPTAIDDSIYLGIANDWLDTLSRSAGAFIGALVVVEYVFGYPGVGRLLVSAVATRDQPVVAAATDRLVLISVLMTALFGLGSVLTSVLIELRQQRILTSPSGRDGRTATGQTRVERFGAPAPTASRRLAVWALVLGGLLLLALLTLALTPSADPLVQSIHAELGAPGQNGHLLGTDSLGRDLAARVAFGLRTMLLVTVSATLLGAGAGLIAGLLAAAFRIADLVVSALVDTAQVVPALAVCLFATSAMGVGAGALSMVLPLVMAFVLARLTRDAAQAIWAGGRPNARGAMGAVVLALLVGLSVAVVLDTTLDFLGVGATPPTPALGAMLLEGRQFLVQTPWLMLAPGLTITALVMSLLLLGYGGFGLLRPGQASAVAASEETVQAIPA